MTHDQAKHLRQKMTVQQQPHRKGRTIAFTSGKGGVGKSNIAINFAIQLALHHERVLVLDLDVGMGNVDVLMGVRATESIVDAFEQNRPFKAIIQPGPGKIDYIAGGSSFTSLFMMNGAHEQFFLSQFALLIESYDYVLFDMGAGLSAESLFFIRSADDVIVITTPEPTALTDGYSIIKQLSRQSDRQPIHIVINRSLSTKSGVHVLEQLTRLIDSFLHVSVEKLAIIPDDQRVQKAVMQQVPFSLAFTKSPATKAVEQMVSTFVTNRPIEQHKQHTSFIHKIKRLLRERN